MTPFGWIDNAAVSEQRARSDGMSIVESLVAVQVDSRRSGGGRPARTLVGIAVVVSAFVGIAPPSADAADMATLSRTLELAHPAPSGAYAEMQRDIDLAAGSYNWSAGLADEDHESGVNGARRSIDLAAGKYRWKCWLEDAPLPYDDSDYVVSCSLERLGQGDMATLEPNGAISMGRTTIVHFESYLTRE